MNLQQGPDGDDENSKGLIGWRFLGMWWTVAAVSLVFLFLTFNPLLSGLFPYLRAGWPAVQRVAPVGRFGLPVQRSRQRFEINRPQGVRHDHSPANRPGVLNWQLTVFRAKCVGFVLMPEHVHALIWLPDAGRLSALLHEWKRVSSNQIRKWYRREGPQYFQSFGEGNRFWLPKYYAFEIDERKKVEEKLIYMHENSVRRGLEVEFGTMV